MKTFRPYEPDQMLLLPPSLQDWVPEGHLARFVSDLADTLRRRGRPEEASRMLRDILLMFERLLDARP